MQQRQQSATGTSSWPLPGTLLSTASSVLATLIGGIEYLSRESTRFEPATYIRDTFAWSPWEGGSDAPGQQQILDAYALALRQQHEKAAFEADEISEAELIYWSPGQVIQNWIRVEAGHSVGKTKIAAGLVSHFFDHFNPSIIYTYAPSWEQIKDLLWKEIAADRQGRKLPGRVLETCEIKDAPNHFAKGRATNNSNNKGTERVQGQHEKYQLFVLDEAEGIEEYVYDAVTSMTSGGISIVLMLANPRTRNSRFYREGSSSKVCNFRISCLHHPNVLQGREVVPGAVKRDYVIDMVSEHALVVEAHDPEAFTFELPWQPGVIYEPSPELMFRVLGIPPLNVSERNLIPSGRYEAAVVRAPAEDRPTVARVGVDVARFGTDLGTLYIRWNGRAWRAGRFSKLDTVDYWQRIKTELLKLQARGVEDVHIRVDGGGGFGGGVVDQLRRDDELIRAFPVYQVQEVHFGGSAKDKAAYYDAITEWTADVAESLKGLSVINAPNELQGDLCSREYQWRNVRGRAVKKLEEKLEFRKRLGRSPDDGDGFVLAVVSDALIPQGPRSGQTTGYY
jgi:hypothetical protein